MYNYFPGSATRKPEYVDDATSAPLQQENLDIHTKEVSTTTEHIPQRHTAVSAEKSTEKRMPHCETQTVSCETKSISTGSLVVTAHRSLQTWSLFDVIDATQQTSRDQSTKQETRLCSVSYQEIDNLPSLELHKQVESNTLIGSYNPSDDVIPHRQLAKSASLLPDLWSCHDGYAKNNIFEPIIVPVIKHRALATPLTALSAIAPYGGLKGCIEGTTPSKMEEQYKSLGAQSLQTTKANGLQKDNYNNKNLTQMEPPERLESVCKFIFSKLLDKTMSVESGVTSGYLKGLAEECFHTAVLKQDETTSCTSTATEGTVMKAPKKAPISDHHLLSSLEQSHSMPTPSMATVPRPVVIKPSVTSESSAKHQTSENDHLINSCSIVDTREGETTSNRSDVERRRQRVCFALNVRVNDLSGYTEQ